MIHWKDGLNGTCRSLQFHLPSSEDALKWWGTRKEVVEEVRVQLSNHAQGLRSNEDVILHEIVGGQLKRLKPEDLKDWQLVESGLGRIAHLAQQRWKKEVGKHHIAFALAIFNQSFEKKAMGESAYKEARIKLKGKTLEDQLETAGGIEDSTDTDPGTSTSTDTDASASASASGSGSCNQNRNVLVELFPGLVHARKIRKRKKNKEKRRKKEGKKKEKRRGKKEEEEVYPGTSPATAPFPEGEAPHGCRRGNSRRF